MNFNNELRTEETPWGSWTNLLISKDYKVKQLLVNPSHRTSYQTHKFREELWTISKGTATITLDDETHVLKRGEQIHIPLGSKHRIANQNEDHLEIIEIQFGTYFGEDDIIRLEDDYNRI